MRILVVEDDLRLATALRQGLREEGMAVDIAPDADAGLAATAAGGFDVIVLDVMLPGRADGFGLCARIRARRVGTPVLMLTARDAVEDRVRGLEAGADDYLTKPFSFRELVARLRALARRHIDNRAAVLQVGDLRLDTRSRQAAVGERTVPLTPKELAILEFFALHQGRLLSRSQVEQAIWMDELAPASNLVEVYVGRIRRKICEAGLADPFVTIRGEGYRLEARRLCDASSDAPAST